MRLAVGLIGAEAARRGAAVHTMIDFVHVLECLWEAAWCLHKAADPAAEDWVAVKALAILAGDSARWPPASPPRPTPPA